MKVSVCRNDSNRSVVGSTLLCYLPDITVGQLVRHDVVDGMSRVRVGRVVGGARVEW